VKEAVDAAMNDKPDSSLARMMAVLDLFDEQQLNLTPERIAEALTVSLPTAYRYVKVLGDAGLLCRQAGGSYGLGPRIIVLDHLIRRSDPVLATAVPLMKELVAQTGLDCVASALYGDQMLDIHREYSAQPASLSYGRGRPRPLLLGAAPKAVLACLPPVQLRRLFASRPAEVAAAGLPSDWPGFRRYFARIRKTGSYVSIGELEPTLAAVAAPLLQPDGRCSVALSLVTSVQRMAVIDTYKLAALVQLTAGEIGARLSAEV
jgi:DNA-binding IclR family transcriptional regulator